MRWFKLIKICLVCKNEFETKGGYSLCCSRNCLNELKQNYFKYAVLCETCNKIIPFKKAREGHKFCSPNCASSNIERIKQQSDDLRNQWKNETFRNSVVNRMKLKNPSKNREIVEKAKQTKLKNGTLHIWAGERGGNGKISYAESKLMDFCVNNGFIYNGAICTRFARELYPDNHYPTSYKPDFVNNDIKLCIEVDGDSHKNSGVKERDIKKEKCLQLLGYTTIRFWNNEIINDFERVQNTILNKMEEMQNGKTSI